MKKAISLLLTFSLLFSILSFDAIAVSPSANVCEIVGGSQYASLDEALAAVQNGQTVTIRLLQNITYNNGISISYDQNKQITFDLNGYNVKCIKYQRSRIGIGFRQNRLFRQHLTARSV